jgi:hypothetical protein
MSTVSACARSTHVMTFSALPFKSPTVALICPMPILNIFFICFIAPRNIRRASKAFYSALDALVRAYSFLAALLKTRLTCQYVSFSAHLCQVLFWMSKASMIASATSFIVFL